MRGLPPVTIRTAERRFRSGPNLLSDLKILAVDGLAPKWFSSSTTQDSMGIEWMTVIYQRFAGRLLRARLLWTMWEKNREIVMRWSCSWAALILSALSAGAADWPQWLGPNRDNSSPEKI